MAAASQTRNRSSVTKKTAAPARSARQLDGVAPVELFTADVQEREPDLVEIFKIDGRSYCMDRNQDASVALKYLKLVRERGENVGLSYLLEEVMGGEAYEALMSFKGITPAQLGQVMLAVQAVLLGTQDQLPKARSSRA